MTSPETLVNWSGTVAFHPARLLRPRTVDELREIVAASPSVRALGSAHSFNRIADTVGDLVSVGELPSDIDIDPAGRTVTVGAGVRFGELAGPLEDAGYALPNLGSLPHISIAGACATGTHGSGARNGVLSTAVAALELVTATGNLVTVTRGDADFPGMVVSLGALGVLTRVTLDIVPTYQIDQVVYDDLATDVLHDDLDLILGSAYSVSVFTDWASPRRNRVWKKSRAGAVSAPPRGTDHAHEPRHPIPGADPESCTEQGGVRGPWHLRLPHFRLEFTPSSGEEIQTEYFVAKADAVAALQALEPIADRIAAVLQISEIRAVAADDLWLSMASGRDSVGVHFTWVKDATAVAPVVAAIEERLAPFGARPHWGKVFSVAPAEIARRYPRYDDFRRLVSEYDPAGKFRNAFFDALFPRW